MAMNIETTLDRLWTNDRSCRDLLGLFDLMPNVYFHIKDTQGRFLWMNTTLRMHLGEKNEKGFLGKTDADYSSSDLVFLYHREDREVMETRRPILNQPWLVPGHSKKTKWFISSKIPLFDVERNVIGTAGIMRDLTHEMEASHPIAEMRDVIDYIFENYRDKIAVETLASLVFLSVRQFERRFRRIFFLTPNAFILKVRIDASVHLLIESDYSITQIAIESGFYDNSFFTRQFKRIMGVSPLRFRQAYAKQDREPPKK